MCILLKRQLKRYDITFQISGLLHWRRSGHITYCPKNRNRTNELRLQERRFRLDMKRKLLTIQVISQLKRLQYDMVNCPV